jgi:two-component system response regulator YesN
MLKIIIVDDEYFIRNGLKKIISRHENYDVIGVAENGIEALKLIKDNTPDVVISDIKMPKMGGIDLISELNKKYPEIEKIVLSGFDEFDYVLNTLKNGARDYILKPVDENVLIESLNSITKNINKNKECVVCDEFKKKSNLVKYNINLLKDVILGKSNIKNEEITKCLKDKRVDYLLETDSINQIIIVKFDNYNIFKRKFGNYEAELKIFTIKNIVDETIDSFCKKISFINSDKIIIVLPNLNEYLNELIKSIIHNLNKYFNKKISIGIGGKIRGFSGLNKSYYEALNILDELTTTLSEDLKTESIKNLKKSEKHISNKEIHNLVEKYYRKFINQIDIADENTIKKFLDEIFKKVYVLNLKRFEVIKIFNNIYTLLQVNLQFMDDWVEDLYGYNFIFENSLNMYFELNDMKYFLKDFYVKIVEKSHKYRNRRDLKLIGIVKDYIEKNYNENLTLNKIAEITYLNPNYFCEFFKEETSQTFIDYLTNVRIKKAKELLKDVRVKVYEVSDIVGYNDSAYFCRVFKKIVGVTPSQFREKL